uniref:Si:ch211-240b21.2 n=1 Tax=Nothobranchius rachovii TaxID=451742 RepID=A0A1A8RRN7_9TELE
MATKLLGPPRPNLNIKQAAVKGGKSYNRGFFRRWYDQTSWLLGCETAGSLFCFPCLLFNPVGTTAARSSWTTKGVTDMHHLAEKGKRHKASKIHMDSCLKFSTFGRVNIAEELDSSYRLAVRSHNEEGMSTTVQNELLDSMLAVARKRITEDVIATRFVAIQADETTDVSTQTQLVLVIRYIDAQHAVQ